MGDICTAIGELFCVIGGVSLALLVLGLLASFVCTVWIDTSNKFRRICKAESLIFEYRENRDKYLEWKRAKELESDE